MNHIDQMKNDILRSFKSHIEVISVFLDDDTGDSRTSLANLLWMCETGSDNINNFTVDKAARWLGYVEGCLYFREIITPSYVHDFTVPDDLTIDESPVRKATETMFSRYSPIIKKDLRCRDLDYFMMQVRHFHQRLSLLDMSRYLGFIQGNLAMLELIDVDEEREYSRTLFHEAYAKAGIIRPKTYSRD